jgi:glycosidase
MMKQCYSRCLWVACICMILSSVARAETMLQYFNTSWAEITNKMPELAEAGYSSLWLPPPTKGSGGLSVGYDMWDPYDLGSLNQRNSVRTRYGTEAELIRLVETAHRFGIRVYFDNIMNHRAFDVPGFNENTPIDLYPGLVAEDFHLRVTQDGFYRKWDNTRSWSDAWQIQNLGLADLIDIAQEPGNTNINFGTSEGSTALKIKFVRDFDRPQQYYHDKDGNYIGFGGLINMARLPINLGPTATDAQAKAWAQAYITTNKAAYEEYVGDYLNRAARWLIDRTKADGLRLDAVKHVRPDFFGATFGADKDTSDYGYNGQVQRQFNLTRGFTDANHRDTVFSTDAPRDDAMLFGEHLGEPPAYGPYIDSGMRLVDNPLREQLNSRLGSPWNGLNGFDQSGYGGFAANQGVMHAQSHDSDYAARRELQHAFYFLRDGLGLLYTDGNYQAETLGESGGAFPRHSNTSFLGQWNDRRVPNLLYIHDQFARGYQVGRWSDGDFVAWERIDKREAGGMSDASGVTLLVMMNDDYSNGQARSFTTSFPAGAYLYNYSDYGGGFYKFANELNTVVVPAGGYFAFSWKNPDPSDLWKNIGGRPITITQNGVEVPLVAVARKDGPNGDKAFNGGVLPDASRPVLPADTNVTDYQYTALVPRVTDPSAVRFIARADGSAENILMKLDSGVNLNATNHALGDPRDNPPAISTDVFMGYEQPNFFGRVHPELFAAQDTARNATGSAGAETFTTTSVVNGTSPKFTDGDTASFLYHDPAAPVGNLSPARNQYDAAGNELWVKTNSVGSGYKCFLYYTTDATNPEGAAGRGFGTTKTAELSYRHNDDGGASDWWSVTPLPADFTASSKYKVGIYKEGASSWWPGNAAAVTRKQKMMTTFETDALNLATVVHRPHADYGELRTGLAEGMHVIRARAFLSRSGQASIYNTFTQSFYYDALLPTGEVRFPENNGDTVGGSQYGMVVCTDPSVTEVWYHITDGDPTNDDSVTRSLNGNGGGFEPFTDSNRNGTRDSAEKYEDLDGDGMWDASVTDSWVRASEVTPSVVPTQAGFQKEWRFNYANIPPSGTASVRVRLREVSSSEYKDFTLSDAAGHFTTLTRTVNTSGPNERIFVAWPPQDGDTVDDAYDVKTYFSKSLATGLTEQQLIDKFLVRIGSSETGAVGNAIARSEYSIVYDETAEFHSLAFTAPNLWNDQPNYLHKITVTFDRTSPLSDLQTERLVKASPSTKPRVSIVNPPEIDSDGKAFEIILPEKVTPAPEDRQFTIRVATSTDVTSVNITVNSGPMNISPPTVTTEGNSKFFDFPWTNIQEGQFTFTATAFTGVSENHDTRRTTVIFRERVPGNERDPDDDDDGLLDADEASATPLPNGYLPTDPKYKPNPEQWTNGEVHVHYAFGKTNPLSSDTDGDGLPDALEVGWRAALVIGEPFDDTGFGSPVVGAGNGIFDFTDTNDNGVHDVGEPSEPFNDANNNGKHDAGTILTTDTDGDGTPNFVGDLDPPFFNTLDNLGQVPGVNTAAEGGDRARRLRGSMTDPSNPDSDFDGIPDGVEDANRNGWLDGDGASLAAGVAPTLGRTWPNGIRDPGEVWTETDPNNADTDGDGLLDGHGEDKNFDGKIAGDTNNNRIWDVGEVWTETDPLKADTDGDGLPDGWEVRFALNPLDTGGVHGAGADPDSDGFTNAQELANGTNPRRNDTIPQPPASQITIGPKTPSIVVGAVTNNQAFTDWKAEDIIALDEYNGDGQNNQGTDIYRAYDGYDSSRDLVAFYARDGGASGSGGSDTFSFRVDFADLKANAEDGNLDIYVVMDFGNPAVGEYSLPDEIDTATNMRWEVCVAVYSTQSGAVLVDTNPASNSTGFNQDLANFGVVRRDQNAINGFLHAHYDATMDSVEFSVHRQALLDAGWNGNATTINYQVFTTKDGTQNSPRGAGDLAGRSDIRDSIFDDGIASDYWRDQSALSGAGSVLKSWFSLSGTHHRGKRTKVISLVQETRPLIPGSEVQDLINTGAGAGFYRTLDVHEAYGVPMSLHLPAAFASAIEWAKVDPAANKPWRDGPAFNDRIASLKTSGVLELEGASFAGHVFPYFSTAYNLDNLQLANEVFTSLYGSSASTAVVYPTERVLDAPSYAQFAALGFTFTFADQMRHITKWFGRSAALSNDGYRINRINGVKTLVVSDQASAFRFDVNDGGLNLPLRELFSRKARSDVQDQVIILFSDWADFLTKSKADAYDINVAWMASHPWIQIITPGQIAAGTVDVTRDFAGDVWPVVERGTNPSLPSVAKDWTDHATQESYDNWFNGQPTREEGLLNKVFEIRPGVPLAQAWGRVGASGLSDTAWNTAASVSGTLGKLARGTAHAAGYLTAFHNQSNGDLSKFSTGQYINPDTTFQNLAGFSKAAQSQMRHSAMFARVASWAAAPSHGATAEDVDLDGEPEYLLFNRRVFTITEAIGGRMVAAWVRDLGNGKVFQVVGNPLSYSGFENETEGAANVLSGKVASYRTSALKDWFAAGTNSVQYSNELYTVSAIAGGWRFTSADGKVQKSVTLGSLANAVAVSYTLDPSISALYVRHGLSPHLLDLIKRGQTSLSSVISSASEVSLINSVPSETVRAYLKLGAGASYNPSAVDDDPGQSVTFDTLNMRNQAQTTQVEVSGGTGMSFSLGFETGPTLSTDLDLDALPDSWEVANNLSPTDATGINGGSGDADGDGRSNLEEFITGTNPQEGDSYKPIPTKVAAGFRIEFPTLLDRTYRVFYSDQLGTWNPLGTLFEGTGSIVQVTDDGSLTTPHPNTISRRFYKVEVSLTNP